MSCTDCNDEGFTIIILTNTKTGLRELVRAVCASCEQKGETGYE